jgi:hypothetical protein
MKLLVGEEMSHSRSNSRIFSEPMFAKANEEVSYGEYFAATLIVVAFGGVPYDPCV